MAIEEEQRRIVDSE